MKIGDPFPTVEFLPEFPCVLNFWSRSCPACHANFPLVIEVQNKFKLSGVHVYFVHRPMSESDLDEAIAIEHASHSGFEDFLIFDSDHKIGNLLGVEAWPTYFLFDSIGKLRRTAKGEFGIRIIEQALTRMFSEENKS
jgi:thiol-disulfide isomerase/thioredoxin